MACMVCFDLSKIMRSLNCMETCGGLVTSESLLEHGEIDCGFEVWHIKPTRHPHIFEGAIF